MTEPTVDIATRWVYAIGPKSTGLIKIGRTNSLAKRLDDLQRMSPVPVTLLWSTEGDHRLELALHHRFAHLRSHGEWFDFGQEDGVAAITAVVDALKADLDAAANEPRTQCPEWFSSLGDLAAAPASREQLALLTRILREVPLLQKWMREERQRIIVEVHETTGMSYTEMAPHLGVKPERVSGIARGHSRSGGRRAEKAERPTPDGDRASSAVDAD